MQVSITIKRHFPELLKLLSQVSDQRKRPVYKVEELLMAVVGMFLFKCCSLCLKWWIKNPVWVVLKKMFSIAQPVPGSNNILSTHIYNIITRTGFFLEGFLTKLAVDAIHNLKAIPGRAYPF